MGPVWLCGALVNAPRPAVVLLQSLPERHGVRAEVVRDVVEERNAAALPELLPVVADAREVVASVDQAQVDLRRQLRQLLQVREIPQRTPRTVRTVAPTANPSEAKSWRCGEVCPSGEFNEIARIASSADSAPGVENPPPPRTPTLPEHTIQLQHFGAS